jgi:hypothetical protein
MIDSEVAMQAAVAEAMKDCGLPGDEDTVENFIDALYAHGYTVVRRLEAESRPETS